MLNSLKRRLVLTLGAALIACFIIIPWWQPLQGRVNRAFINLASIGSAIGQRATKMLRVQELIEENIRLSEQHVTNAALVAEIEKLRLENSELRETALLPSKQGLSTVGADVIGEQADEFGMRYLINRGRNDGVAPGQAVILAGGASGKEKQGAVLIGVVNTVSEQLSSFVLISAPGSRVAAETLRESPARGLVTGEYSLALKFSLVPRTSTLAVGDMLVSSNANQFIPAGLLIGSITNLVQEDGAFFQTAIVAPVIPTNHFKQVYVVVIPETS